MKRPTLGLILCAIVVVSALNLSGQSPETPRQGFLSNLKEGQSVTVKEVVGRFEISTIEGLPMQSHTILKIGPDSLTIEDIGGVMDTTIPVSSIKSIVRFKAAK